MTNVKSIDRKLSSSPQLIIVGGEGRGLRSFLMNNAHSFLELLPAHDPAALGVDSLNVSVAAAMLCNEVLVRMRVGDVQRQRDESSNKNDVDASVGDQGKTIPERTAKEAANLRSDDEVEFSSFESEIGEEGRANLKEKPNSEFVSYRMANLQREKVKQEAVEADEGASKSDMEPEDIVDLVDYEAVEDANKQPKQAALG
jgi:hypothetical protein